MKELKIKTKSRRALHIHTKTKGITRCGAKISKVNGVPDPSTRQWNVALPDQKDTKHHLGHKFSYNRAEDDLLVNEFVAF